MGVGTKHFEQRYSAKNAAQIFHLSPRRVFKAGLALRLIPIIAFIFAIEARGEEIRSKYWRGHDKCDTLFETPLSMLPGGSYLKAIMGENSVQAHYALSSGGTLRLTMREVGKVPVKGENYTAAYKDLVKRRPLQDSIARKVENSAVLADVKSLKGISYSIAQSPDKSEFLIEPTSLTLTLTAKVRVADWVEYPQASASSQKNWDRHLCVSYHHELGHILVAAQMLEEAQTEWLQLRAPSREELRQKQKEFLTTVGQRIRDRQVEYHDALEKMGPTIGRSRPYLELPFTWLSDYQKTTRIYEPNRP